MRFLKPDKTSTTKCRLRLRAVWGCRLLTIAICLTPLALSGQENTPQTRSKQDDLDKLVYKAEQERIRIVQSTLKSAISIFGPGGNGGGSGVVISADGYAITNFHVTQPCGTHMKCSMPNGKLYDAVIVGVDPTGDVALIKLFSEEPLPFAKLADSNEVEVGQWCFAVGNPFLLATDFQPTVTYGLVSGVHRYQYPSGTLLEYTDCIQVDASINPGNSGGPLYNMKGELIGINGRGSFEKRGRVNVGVGYAISINQVKNFLDYLKSGRIVDHATLGAQVFSDADGQVVVNNILSTSDAYRRGLRYGDEIVFFADRPIHHANDFKNVLGIYPKGWRVPLTFRREGVLNTIQVRLAGVHRPAELLNAVEKGAPAQRPPGQKKLPKNHKVVSNPKEYEQKKGYANYYFNELHRKRVWDRFVKVTDWKKTEANWQLKFTDQNSSTVELGLNENQVGGLFPLGPELLDLSKDLDQQLVPLGSGGLLVAAHLWKHLLQEGPEKFGELYYLGAMPLPTMQNKQEVFVAVHDVVECRFYFDSETGLLSLLELYPDEMTDPCEIYFTNYQVQEGMKVPVHWRVIWSDFEFSNMQLKELKITK
ncbi:MAG: trypsin-like peptidase domain-containing protein [Pirellulaceae bacterium]|nr:trypsin-like peptidase domain-containing protein [Pirellulaceae bacterium]